MIAAIFVILVIVETSGFHNDRSDLKETLTRPVMDLIKVRKTMGYKALVCIAFWDILYNKHHKSGFHIKFYGFHMIARIAKHFFFLQSLRLLRLWKPGFKSWRKYPLMGLLLDEWLIVSLTPSDNSKSINHSCVRVCSNNTVRVHNFVNVKNNTAKVLEINLKFKPVKQVRILTITPISWSQKVHHATVELDKKNSTCNWNIIINKILFSLSLAIKKVMKLIFIDTYLVNYAWARWDNCHILECFWAPLRKINKIKKLHLTFCYQISENTAWKLYSDIY